MSVIAYGELWDGSAFSGAFGKALLGRPPTNETDDFTSASMQAIHWPIATVYSAYS